MDLILRNVTIVLIIGWDREYIFFDDYEKALWWSATAVLHNNDFGRVIFRATIEAPDEEVLDLDDNKQLDAFFAEIIQCIDEIKKNCSGNMPVFDDKKFSCSFL